MHDAVNRPAHYIGDGLEAIDVIEDWGLGFHLGNAFKYIVRAGRKSKLLGQDLQKAIWYLERARRPRNMLGLVSVYAPMKTGVIGVAQAFGLSPKLRAAVLQLHGAACYASAPRKTGDMTPLQREKIDDALERASDAVMLALREAAGV